ncbi:MULTISPECIES: hypothetical protein [Citrobacter]|uniref:hypothetical protein n=1 Tax=Citrobacter TaxID=544 RepID=UPI0018FFD243|nr:MULTISPECIES: hypothetical protein [Citrobacter]MBJ9134405.1 hypothetical protein [Citrobacter farmeri]MDM2738409.1 hypothetical protein [Citrobacter sp. Ct235]
MTKRLDNKAVKQYMQDKNINDFHDNAEIKDIIMKHKYTGLSSSSKGLNALYMFIVLKEADELTNKEVQRIIDNFKSEQCCEKLMEKYKGRENRLVRKVINTNKITDGDYNLEYLQLFDNTLEPHDIRSYERYGHAIRAASEEINSLISAVPVQQVTGKKTHKQALQRMKEFGITEEELLRMWKSLK